MSHNKLDDGLALEWDELLRDGLVRPPADFQTRVMNLVQNDAGNLNTLPSSTGSLTALLQSAAVLIATIAAGWQTFAFIISLWATSVAI